MLADISFCTYWFVNEMFYFANRIAQQNDVPQLTNERKIAALESVEKVYDAIYPDGDMEFEQLKKLMILNWRAAVLDAENRNTDGVKCHLERAAECALKSVNISAHDVNKSLLFDWHVDASPNDSKQAIRELLDVLKRGEFDFCREQDWFKTLENSLTDK